ncbi:MAG: excinuclease ABC subunit UvrC [Bacillota bacterium]|nr:excinuclease ABC subunit UvrC [Bacillota bacterium]
MELRDRLKSVPLLPGVYLYKNKDGKIIYVGKAKKLRNRMRSYFQSADSLHPKVRAMMARVEDFEYTVTSSEVEALILENNLIKSYQPRYNILLRDDKTYPYLKITAEAYPRICIVREKKDQESRYFGPFTDVGSLKETVRLLKGIFPLRSCTTFHERQRPCLNYDMGKCLAPCTGQVNQEDYQQMVDQLVTLLEGRAEGLLAQKQNEMQAAAANLEFEKAARLRDQVRAIQVLGEKQKVSFEQDYNLDLIGMIAGERENLILSFQLRGGNLTARDTFWMKSAIADDPAEMMGFFLKQHYDNHRDIPLEILVNMLPGEQELLEEWLSEKNGKKVHIKVPVRGDKHKLMNMLMENANLLWNERMEDENKVHQALLHLAEVLRMEALPERMECYDISHFAGEETVASMVVFSHGKADNKSYRRFKISRNQNDDFASMSETLERRFTEAKKQNPHFLPEPDLLVIDGGLGQVHAVKKVLDDMGVDIPVIGLAKKNELIFRPGVSEPIALNRRDEGLMILQRLRDEAHRFAIQYNRQRRGKKLTRSVLDQIEGIGDTRKKQLLKHFGSVSKIREASVEELCSAPGMNQRVARAVYLYFHPDEVEK